MTSIVYMYCVGVDSGGSAQHVLKVLDFFYDNAEKIFGPRGLLLTIADMDGIDIGSQNLKIPYGDQIFLSELLTQFNILYT